MGKTFLDEIAIAEQSSAPGTPPSGYQYVYPKTDGKMYAKNSSGVETEITSGGITFEEVMRIKSIFTN